MKITVYDSKTHRKFVYHDPSKWTIFKLRIRNLIDPYFQFEVEQ